MMAESPAGYRLLLCYDVSEDRMQEYYRFMLGRYVPMVQALGLDMSDAWHTAYGDFPNRLVGFISRDRETIDDLLENETWQSLNEELQRFVSGFEYRVVPYREGFQFF